MSNRGSITLPELQGKLDLLDMKCHRCERHGRVALPDWSRNTALHMPLANDRVFQMRASEEFLRAIDN